MHYLYTYPDSATIRLANHPNVLPAWKHFSRVHCGKSHEEKGTINYTASWRQFFRDLWTLWGTYNIINTLNVPNSNAQDWGYEILGSFRGYYTITLDCKRCVKTLKMQINNSFSMSSLTRNPFSKKPLLTKPILNPVFQTFVYNVEWNASWDGVEIRSR